MKNGCLNKQIDPFELKIRLPKISITEDNLWNAFSIFNPNEYHPSLEKQIRSCAYRYAAILTHGKATIGEIQKQLKKGFTVDFTMINQELPTKQDFFLEFNYPNILSNLEAFLIATKSLLDVLSTLLTHKIGKKITGFHRKGPKDKPIYGGRVLNALKNTKESKFPHRDKLISIIEHHKKLWIDNLIAMRDQIVHGGELKDFINFWTVIRAGRKKPYSDVDVFPPLLKNEGEVKQYCEKILKFIEEFIKDFLNITFPPEERCIFLAVHKK